MRSDFELAKIAAQMAADMTGKVVEMNIQKTEDTTMAQSRCKACRKRWYDCRCAKVAR